MIANTINGKIRTFNSIPKVFELKKNVMNYNRLDADVHYEDGFRELINPTLEPNQYTTVLYFDTDNDVYTYEVETYTEEELVEQKEQKEFNLYQSRKIQGLNLYLLHQAKWVMLYNDEKITKEVLRQVENNFKPVREELVLGQLKSALEIMEILPALIDCVVIKENLQELIDQLYE